MITCKSIKKSYENQQVLDDFSYSFNDTGFYLLYGISGSGKTTLLNILAGHLSFDEGFITYNGKEYQSQVNSKDIEAYTDYITQDANFIDYLSVYDNLALCSKDKETIEKYLQMFGLLDMKKMLPRKLSGGEKQRVCLVRSLIRGKKIILLDEPTASLDMENKVLVFETLKKLKEDILIICSSHDESAKKYADECINFNNKEEYSKNEIDKKICNRCEGIESSNRKLRNPAPFVRKWFKSPLKNKASKIWFAIIMFLALLVLYMGDTPKNKFASSVEYIYGYNQLELWATESRMDFIEALYERDDIKEIVLDYSGSVPLDSDAALDDMELPDELKEIIEQSDKENGYINVDYEVALWTLPINEENFHLEDYLACGRYIENENEIILAHDAIPEGVNPESYIGRTKEIKLYGDEYTMTIVGVFKEPTLAQRQYLYSSGIKISADKDGGYVSNYAISAAITNKYIDDVNFFSDVDDRCYYLYFDSYSDMKAFYDENETGDGLIFVPPDIEYSLTDIFDMMNKYMYPIGLLVSVMAVVFYYQVQRTELLYNKKLFMVYQYLGYSIKKIKAWWLIFSVYDMLKTFVLSWVMSLLVTYGINILNREKKFVAFEIFTYNINVMIQLIIAIVITGILSATFMLRKLNIERLSENLAKQRDLL